MSNASHFRMHCMFAWSSCQEHRRPLSGRPLPFASARCRAVRQTAIVPSVLGIPDITGNTFVVFPAFRQFVDLLDLAWGRPNGMPD